MNLPRAAIYVRISKDRDDQISTEIQRERCEAYAANRSWPVTAVYADLGRSAYKRTATRPQLDELLADVDSGAVGALVVYRLDRLARSVADFANIWARLERAGCEFVSVSENFDTSTAIGRAMLQVAVTFAELESGIRSERISDWHRARIAAGKPHSGRAPFGYGPGWELVPEQAARLHEAADRILHGDALAAIARDWNRQGVPAPAGYRAHAGGAWTSATIKRALLSPTAAGLRRFDGALVEGNWEPILDRATWDHLAVVLNDPERRAHSKGVDRQHLLSGFLRCGRCGCEMYGASRKRGAVLRYACRRRAGRPEACQSVSIDAASTDVYVVDLVKAALAGLPLPDRAEAGARVDPTAGIQADLDDLARMFGAGEITRGEWVAASEGLRARLRAEADQGDAPAPPTHLDLSNFDALTIGDRHRVVRWLFDSITVAPHDRSQPRNLSAPAHRVAVSWRV